MEQIKARVRKWGNSFGIILPKDFMDSKKIGEGSEISVRIEPSNMMTVGDVLELAKKFKLKRKGDTQKILDEIDRELWPEEE
ncbi:AbrB/MazE/SpoVT family DNA-binding domain-containing protein [Candidatus Pacearchaeota archaeon]|nr:AbrB/MazE/SpoVT family DNA-binding domain-containing protein [Candidatus Pacearchaeota archaeon]